MKFLSVTFIARRRKWQLQRVDPTAIKFTAGKTAQSFMLTEETYRFVAIKMYELIYGEIGTYGDLQPYVDLLKKFLREK